MMLTDERQNFFPLAGIQSEGIGRRRLIRKEEVKLEKRFQFLKRLARPPSPTPNPSRKERGTLS